MKCHLRMIHARQKYTTPGTLGTPAAHVGNGNVFLVRATWNSEYVEELRNFPAEIARLALIIAEFQCDVLYRGQKDALAEFFAPGAEFAVVVSDLSMPECNGLELAARFRAVKPLVPFVLASGFFSAAEETEAEALRVTLRLHKPLTYAGLGRAVASFPRCWPTTRTPRRRRSRR